MRLFQRAVNQTFKIVDITDPNDPRTRLFRSPAGATLTEGSVFTAGGVAFQISYVGGDGNDITLKRVSTPPAFQNRSITPSVTEGGVVTLSGLITEPDNEDTFFLDVDWGDGNTETFTFAPGSPHQVAVSHRYLNDAPTYSPIDTYPVRMVWHDEHGGSNSATLQAVVRNVAPQVGDLRFETPPVHGQAATLRGSLFDPGPQDRILVKIDWGDGSALETVEVSPGEATFAKSHLYATPGVYRVSVQPADERTVGKKTTLKIRIV